MNNLRIKKGSEKWNNEFKKLFFDKDSPFYNISNILFKTQPYWTKDFFLKKPSLWLGYRGMFFYGLTTIIRMVLKKLVIRIIIKNIFKNCSTNNDILNIIYSRLSGSYTQYLQERQKCLSTIINDFDKYL